MVSGLCGATSVAGLTFVNWQEPIGCGGVAVFPDHVMVTDCDGAVVIPKALVANIAAGPEQERFENGSWVRCKKGCRCQDFTRRMPRPRPDTKPRCAEAGQR